MSEVLNRVRNKIFKIFIKTPILNRYPNFWYSKLGVKGEGYRIGKGVVVIGSYKHLNLGHKSEINAGCFLLAKDEIKIGANSTLAFQVTILTSANPNGPHNKLVRLYPPIRKPVTIGENCWIGARATILPGVTIGKFSIVAAGSIVTRDVPDYTVVAGVPAREVKKLDESLLI